MSTNYDQITAEHYAAFRPSLHLPILAKCLGGNAKYDLGLDVGCGTGQSALALTHFCKRVIGIDSSMAMLEKTTPHGQVEYRYCNGSDLDFEDSNFDIITLAGSWYYGKSQKLLDEMTRVCKAASTIVVYDFEILFKPILKLLGVTPAKDVVTNYVYESYFTGLNAAKFVVQQLAKEQTQLEISSQNLAHVLLSDKKDYKLLCDQWGENKLYDTMVAQLQKLAQGESHRISAYIFYGVFAV